MGFLRFLSRKPTGEKARKDAKLKAQAYDSTVASSPPIRGTVPVAGNGNITLDKFTRSHTDLRESHSEDGLAPPPVIGRIRTHSSERLATALSNRGQQERVDSSLLAPDFRAQSKAETQPASKKKYGPYRLSATSAMMEDGGADAIRKSPSPALTSDRSSWLHNEVDFPSTAKGFVDLLDAQSNIRPYNFYTRLEAAGARDYAEDVADRNMRKNGLGVNLARSQDFRSQSQKLHSTIGDLRKAMEVSDEDRSHRRENRHSLGPGPRIRLHHTKSRDRLPRETMHQHDQENMSTELALESRVDDDARQTEKAEKAARRRSMPSYVAPTSSIDQQKNTSKPRRAKETGPQHFPDSLRLKPQANITQGDNPRNTPEKANTSRKQVDSPKKARGLQQQSNVNHQSSDIRDDAELPLPDGEVRVKPTKTNPRRKTVSHIWSERPPVAAASSIPQSPTKERIDQTKRSMMRRIGDSPKGKVVDIQNQRRPKHRNKPSRESLTQPYESESVRITHRPISTRISEIPSSRCRPNSREGAKRHVRNRSTVSTSSKKSLEDIDIEESIPERSSSLRHWSTTSDVASTHSSNPFRPPSGHTTNTSMEFSPQLERSKPTTSGNSDQVPLDYLRDVEKITPPRPPPKSRLRPQPQQQVKPRDFNIDDYISSDDTGDSPYRLRGEDESELLFDDRGGFDFGASQLPGLPSPLEEPAPIMSGISPVTPASAKNASRHQHDFATFSSVPHTDHHPSGRDYEHLYASLFPQQSYEEGQDCRAPNESTPNSDFSDFESDLRPRDRGSRYSSSSDEMNFDIPLTRRGRDSHRLYQQQQQSLSQRPEDGRQRHETADAKWIQEERDSDTDFDLRGRTTTDESHDKPKARTLVAIRDPPLRKARSKPNVPANRDNVVPEDRTG